MPGHTADCQYHTDLFSIILICLVQCSTRQADLPNQGAPKGAKAEYDTSILLIVPNKRIVKDTEHLEIQREALNVSVCSD